MVGSGSPRREFDYVEDRSCCRSQLNCLCGTGSCRLCCRGFPPVKESTYTRLVYVIFLLCGVLLMAVFISEEIQGGILDWFPSDFAMCEWLGAAKGCHEVQLMGYIAVYRIGFAISLYHVTLMLATYGVKSSKDGRAGLHNGMWFYKFLLFVVLCVVSFFIPDRHDYLLHGWMYTAMVGAAAFIVMQLLLLVFLVHTCTDRIEKRVSDGASAFKWYIVVCPSIALVAFGLCVAGVVLLYVYFAWNEACHHNQWLILCNAAGCAIVSLVAALKTDGKPFGLRLMHASLISLYVTYLTWSAMSSAPRKFQKYSSYAGGGGTRARFSFRQNYYCGPAGDEASVADSVIPYVNFVVTILTVIYGSLGVSEPTQCRSLQLPTCPDAPKTSQPPERDDTGGQIVIRNEKTSLTYSYPLFHLMLCLACLLLMMHLTAWYTPTKATLGNFGRSWSAVWMKMASSWLCLAAYFITVLCPTVLPKSLSSHLVREEAPSSVRVNRHASFDYFDTRLDFDGEYLPEDVDETAVPLTASHRPTQITTRQETTV